MSKILSFNVTYDSGSDVLYITRVFEAAARGVEDQHGIVWRYGASGDVISAVVLDFRELWEDRQPQLAKELAQKFHIPAPQAQTVIISALENRTH